jgi:competence protein ComEC
MMGFNKRYKLKYLSLCAAILLLAILLNAHLVDYVQAQPFDILHVTFIDVGQGDSALLRTDTGTSILIDAGPRSAGETVVAFLDSEGITTLDVVVLSHNHADHIGGFVDVFDSSIEVGLVLYNGNACTTIICQTVWSGMSERGIVPTAVHSGDAFIWGTISSEILNPQSTPTNDENEDSIVMTTVFYGHSLLFTGDIGFMTENHLVNQGRLAKQDVLKVAHHGSAYSTSSAFLDLVRPNEAVISVGANNTYGHPSDETLNRLADSGANIYRTDLDGNVTFSFIGFYDDGPRETQVYLPLIINHAGNDFEPPLPDEMPGENIHCHTDGQVELCASVSNANPPRYSSVTVYGRLVINDQPQAGKPMFTTWHYKSTTSHCDGEITGSGGLASCARSIGGASAGYQVNIDVMIVGYSVTTSFTPTDQ